MSLLLLFQSAAVSDNWTLGVTRAEFDVDGQEVTFDLDVAIDAAALAPAGQDVDLTATGDTPVVVADQPTGGYGFGAFDRKLRKKIEEEDERQQLADRLEQVLIDDGSLSRSEADRLRLSEIASQYQSSDLPNKVRRALDYAQRVRTEQAYTLALRELQKLQDEEETAILMTLLLDD
jgi:hypothetical protein